MNTVLEKFFEVPEPPQPEKTDDDKDNSEDEDEEEKQNKDYPSRLKSSAPTGIEDFSAPYAGDDDAEDDIQKIE